MSQPTFSDEILMAYADGELPEPEALAVRKAERQDPAIARRIAMFKASRKVLSAAFDPVLDQPVPERLYDAVRALGRDDTETRGLRRRRWTGAVVAWLDGWRQPAMAVSVAGLAGIAAGWWIGTSALRPGDSGNLATEVASLPASLVAALDRLPSGERLSTRLDGGAADLLPIASYQNGAFLCREFEVSRSSRGSTHAVRGVVCRRDGRWLLRAVADLAPGDTGSNEYRPASGSEDLAPVLGLGRSLSQQEERDFLSNGWLIR